MPNVISPTTTASLRDSTSMNETSESADDGIYPPDILTDDQILKGGFILYAFGLFYMFCALAIVCDEFFVPALEVHNSKHADCLMLSFLSVGHNQYEDRRQCGFSIKI
jgi:hypothetical protein